MNKYFISLNSFNRSNFILVQIGLITYPGNVLIGSHSNISVGS